MITTIAKSNLKDYVGKTARVSNTAFLENSSGFNLNVIGKLEDKDEDGCWLVRIGEDCYGGALVVTFQDKHIKELTKGNGPDLQIELT